MSKGTRKLTGFLWAMLLAIISFFVIYIFFQDVSLKAFGVSMKHPEKIGQIVSDAVKTTTDKVAGAVSEAVDKVVDKTADKAAEMVASSLEESLDPEKLAESVDLEGVDLENVSGAAE